MNHHWYSPQVDILNLSYGFLNHTADVARSFSLQHQDRLMSYYKQFNAFISKHKSYFTGYEKKTPQHLKDNK